MASQVASHNMANVSTDGYSRQRATLQAEPPWMSMVGPLGTGVQVSGIHRLQDSLLASRQMDATADLGYGSGRVSVLQAAESILGIGAADPLDAALGRFFQSLEDLAAHPDGSIERQQVLQRAKDLGKTFSQVYTELESIRSNLDQQVSTQVTELQTRIEQIAMLNREIRLNEAGGGVANDLRDRRELLARQVAEKVAVNVFSNEHGDLNLSLKSGGVLVEVDRAASLDVEAVAGNGSLLSPVLVSGSGTRTRLNEKVSGSLGGLLSARDQDVAQAMSQLDTLAFEVAGQVNTIHQAGFGLDGLGARNLFNPIASANRAADNLFLDAAVDGQPDAIAAAQGLAAIPGDNRNALALAALSDSDLMGGSSQTFSEYWRASVGQLGAGLSGAKREQEFHQSRLSQLDTMRESVSGVSIDEEMIELTKAQRAFEAAAKIIQTGDELLETVLALK
jgi:flagellar hook-associated protein 1 FlgK